jgi:hypothetical protein
LPSLPAAPLSPTLTPTLNTHARSTHGPPCSYARRDDRVFCLQCNDDTVREETAAKEERRGGGGGGAGSAAAARGGGGAARDY